MQGADAEEGNSSKEKEYSNLLSCPQLRKEMVSHMVYLYEQAYTDLFCLHSQLERYKPAPVEATLILCCPSFHTAQVQHCQDPSRDNCTCPYRYTLPTASVHVCVPPEPSLKASKDEGNLSSKLSCLCLTRLSGWEGGKGRVSQYVCKL